MIRIEYDDKLEIIMTYVEGQTPAMDMTNYLKDLSNKFSDFTHLYVLMDLTTAEIKIDTKYYSADLVEATEIFVNYLSPFKRISIAHVIREEDELTNVLIKQFFNVSSIVPAFRPEIFRNRTEALQWIEEQKKL